MVDWKGLGGEIIGNLEDKDWTEVLRRNSVSAMGLGALVTLDQGWAFNFDLF